MAADKGFRYTDAQNKWLHDKVTEATSAGVARLSEVSKLLLDEWCEMTERKISTDSFCQKIKKHEFFRNKAQNSDSAPRVRRQFAEGSKVAVMSKSGVVSMHKDLDSALTVVNGAVADCTFYECREFKVSYKTVLVVE